VYSHEGAVHGNRMGRGTVTNDDSRTLSVRNINKIRFPWVAPLGLPTADIQPTFQVVQRLR
jgi:hypothetical protein